ENSKGKRESPYPQIAARMQIFSDRKYVCWQVALSQQSAIWMYGCPQEVPTGMATQKWPLKINPVI
ncbi:MAG TPA: hypothetical protein VGO51_08090, partial [Burkholderiaceae bacterium]|nr:hypothetical protein [Burkholderiaceae bacterium]